MASISTGESLSSLALKLYGDCKHKHYARMLRRDICCAREMLAYVDHCHKWRLKGNLDSTAENRVRGRLVAFDKVAGAVLNTYELLEMILLFSWPKTIIALQRVSTTFRTVIANSRRLRRATYQEPPPEACVPVVNRLFYHPSKLQLGPWSTICYGPRRTGDGSKQEMIISFELNDSFYSRARPLSEVPDNVKIQSWRSMMLSQPLCDRIIVRLYSRNAQQVLERLEIERGNVSMGEVQDVLREMYARTVSSKDWRLYGDHHETFKKNIGRFTGCE